MKFNWKILLAVVTLSLAIVWGFTSVSTQSYSGTNLEFSIGSGVVSITNPSTEAQTVQLVGSGTRSFSLFNSSIDVTGTSEREGRGSGTTQTLVLEIPSGTNEFAIARGRDVNFIATNSESMQATVQPLNASESQSTIIAVAVIVIVSLFFISQSIQHSWIKQLRNQGKTTPIKPVTESVSSSQGDNLKSFGDNRSK